MAENKFNLNMLKEMQASFELTERRQQVPGSPKTISLTRTDGNKKIVDSIKLDPATINTDANNKHDYILTHTLHDINISHQKSAVFQKKQIKNLSKDLTNVNSFPKMKKLKNTVLNTNKAIKSFSPIEGKVKKCMAKKKIGLDAIKGYKDSKYFEHYNGLNNNPKNNTKFKKNEQKLLRNFYDFPHSIDKRIFPQIIKDNGSDYTKREDLFHVPQIFKSNQCQLYLNLDKPLLKWPLEMLNPLEKYWWGKKYPIPAAKAKIKEIYLHEDKNDILYLKKELQTNTIEETIKQIAKKSPDNNTFENYPIMDTEVQDDFSEFSVFENSLNGMSVLGVIKGSLEFYGTLIVTLLCGEMSVNGFKAITNQPLTIYSPKGIYWVSIKSEKRERCITEYNINLEKLNQYFSNAQLDNIIKKFNIEEDAIVLLEKNMAAKNLLSMFNKNMNQNIFPMIYNSNRPYYQSEYLLDCLIQRAGNTTILQVPSEWNQLTLNKSTRIIVVGGKSVGKTSLVRYLVNRHLNQFGRFLLIDLDIGQPEIFLPQTISCCLIDAPLLGPGFFLNKEPERAYVVGSVNILMCVDQYIQAVKQLMEYVHKTPKYAQIPWLVNTMGYNKGFGLELIAFLIQIIKPTDVVQISSTVDINNFDLSLECKILKNVMPIFCTKEQFSSGEMHKYILHGLYSVAPSRDRGIWTMSSKDMRYCNLLANLSKCLNASSKCLSHYQPFRASLESLEIVHPISQMLSRVELIAGMEANVVYLAKKRSTGLPECLGIGIVRAIDYKKGLLYISPSTSFLRLNQVDCLISAGEFTLPTGFFKYQGSSVANDVPFVFQLEDSKSSKPIQQTYRRPPAFVSHLANRKS